MGQRKVYYYTISIKEVCSDNDVLRELKNIFNNIFDNYCVEHKESDIKTLALCNKEVMLDIIYEDNTYLFGRVGKETEHYNVVKRNKSTLQCKYAIDGDDAKNTYLEICTHFLLDYTNGIVGFIFGKSAPSVHSLINIVNEYDQNYIMNIENIASEDSIKSLLKPGATLGKIKYVYRLPNVEILEHLGLSKSQIGALLDTNIMEAELILKNTRKLITNDGKVINNIFTAFSKLPQTIKDTIKFYGKTPNSSSKDYRFDYQEISFSVDIDEYRSEAGKKIKLEPDEVAEKVLHKLRSLYKEHKMDIMRFAGLDY
ncbi:MULTISPECIES: hypothetical protein [unclassified Clostridium]|uniref:hypothetical protein n=1 Tax=unclassified Clostridium TaxID=2614128 RepID=UPI0025C4EC3D|nr:MULTISPECIES: hypothetical protein [unclassified Clostridium]